MLGYCALHNLKYELEHLSDICPACLESKERELKERDIEQDTTLGEDRRSEYGDLD